MESVRSVLSDPATMHETAELMRLLADPTRLRVLSLLEDGEMNVSTLCRELDVAQPTVSHHLGLLREAGILLCRREGKQVFYSINPTHLQPPDDRGCLHLRHGHLELHMCAVNAASVVPALN